jgi:hypothetical protein
MERDRCLFTLSYVFVEDVCDGFGGDAEGAVVGGVPDYDRPGDRSARTIGLFK